MKILNNCTFAWVYDSYLTWFAERARPGAVPKQKEEIAEASFYGEDVFEGRHIILNRLVYYVPLTASETKSGRPEVFGFTELNMMENDDYSDVGEVVAVEYALL